MNERSRYGIAEYCPPGITVFPDQGVLEPAPVHAGWTTHVAHRAVRALAMTSEGGVLWVATWGGVLRWDWRDDYVYRRYSSEHGLAGTPSCLCLDADGLPWVGHDEGGLSWFEGNRWHVHDSLRTVPVRRICATSDRGVWAAGTGTLYRVSGPDAAQVVEIGGGRAECAEVRALLADGDAVLIGGPLGLFRLGPFGAPTPVAGGVVTSCSALARAPDGALWVATPHGVVQVRDDEVVETYAPDGAAPHVTALATARDGAWALTTGGVARLLGGAWRDVPGDGAHPATPRAIATGPGDDYLWVGTDTLLHGLSLHGSAVRWDLGLLPPHAEDTLANAGRCAAAAAGRVWVGTAAGLLEGSPGGNWSFDADLGDVRALCRSGAASVAPRDGESETVWLLAWPTGVWRLGAPEWWRMPLMLPPGLPTALGVGRGGHAYVVVGNALWRLGDGAPARVAGELPTGVHALAQLAEGSWWLGTPRGLYWLRSGASTPAPASAAGAPSPPMVPVHALHLAGDVLWAGTAAGLWSLAGGAWRRHDLEPARIGGVSAIAAADAPDALWLAHAGAVVRWSPAAGVTRGPFTRFDTGIGSGRITALAECGGSLWVVTHAGVARLDLSV